MFLALEQANHGCVLIWKTFNSKIFQCVFWSFKPSIEGFEHCCPVLSIDGTYLHGKYKGTLMIAMGCDGNNHWFPLAFAIIDVASLSRPGPLGRIRTESGMPLKSLHHSKSYLCGSNYKIVQAHKHLHLTKSIYNEGTQAFSK